MNVSSRYHEVVVSRALWDHLPVGALVIDKFGVIRNANQRMLQMAGSDHEDEVLGQSVFDFLMPEAITELVDAFERSGDFSSTVLGPWVLRFRTNHGSVAAAECWAYPAPDDLGFDGYVVTMTAESTTDLLATATRAIASGADLSRSLSTIGSALGAFPVSAVGSILVVDNGAVAGVLGSWPFPDERAVRHPDHPWAAVGAGTLAGGTWLVDDLPPVTARLAREHGLQSVWAYPIDIEGTRRGVLVAWRSNTIQPTPNQLSHIGDAAAAASLAFTQADRRAQLQRAAVEDHLTGVGNRAGLAHRTRVAADGPCAVLFVDLDFFKQVNDDHGHSIGDEVLRVAAKRLTRVVHVDDEVYRLGGDEFAIVCGPSHDDATARARAEQLAAVVVDTIALPIELSGHTISIGASVGVAVAPTDSLLVDVLDRADVALLDAKRAGRGRWRSGV